MFIANYGLKSLVQKAAMVARLPLDYSHDHPYTGLKERALTRRSTSSRRRCREQLAFDTPRELMHYALSRVTLDGIVCRVRRQRRRHDHLHRQAQAERTIHGFDSFEGLPEDWSGNAMDSRLLQSQRQAAEGAEQRAAASRLVHRQPAEVRGANTGPAGVPARRLRSLFVDGRHLRAPRRPHRAGHRHRVRRILQLSGLAGARAQGVRGISSFQRYQRSSPSDTQSSRSPLLRFDRLN